MTILYFDCFAGISGDMTIGALLDLGVPLEHLEAELRKLHLPLSSWSIGADRTSRRGMSALHFHVTEEEHQPHRRYNDIALMIEGSALSDAVKERAQKIFFRLAEAEAKVHGVPLDRVHFHEVGALDSIIDIVGAAICLDYLRVTELHVSPLPLGSGFVETAHGLLPVPAPATAELLNGVPVVPGPGPGERVTPTGAAIVATLATVFGRAPEMTVTGIGCGAGTKDFPELPNILRVFRGEREGGSGETVTVLETHLDDTTPECLGYLMERLLEEGALDAAFSPLQMKKNRPATKLTVILRPHQLDAIARLVFAESSTIGVRYYDTKRIVLKRELREVETSLGTIKVKVLSDNGGIVRIAPEFDECRRIAREKGLPLPEVYRIVEREAAV